MHQAAVEDVTDSGRISKWPGATGIYSAAAPQPSTSSERPPRTWPAEPDMPDTLPASELPSTSKCGGSGGNGTPPKRLPPRNTLRCSITSAARVRLPVGLLQHGASCKRDPPQQATLCALDSTRKTGADLVARPCRKKEQTLAPLRPSWQDHEQGDRQSSRRHVGTLSWETGCRPSPLQSVRC